MNHSWLKNAVRCAFDRIYSEGDRALPWIPAAWHAVHVLHRYGIDYYDHLNCDVPE